MLANYCVPFPDKCTKDAYESEVSFPLKRVKCGAKINFCFSGQFIVKEEEKKFCL